MKMFLRFAINSKYQLSVLAVCVGNGTLLWMHVFIIIFTERTTVCGHFGRLIPIVGMQPCSLNDANCIYSSRTNNFFIIFDLCVMILDAICVI